MSDEKFPANQEPKRIKRTPEIEAAIGAQVRALRIAAYMSQTALGDALGVSFQQIQKYEMGKDRLAASTLQALAVALGVHPGSLFDDMPLPAVKMPVVKGRRENFSGVRRISDPKIRRRLAALIATLAGETES